MLRSWHRCSTPLPSGRRGSSGGAIQRVGAWERLAATVLTTRRRKFDYFGVLISVIFGLALTHLLRGLGRLIQMRHESRAYWVHIVWTINVVMFVLAVWWGMYWWKGLQDWTFGWFLFVSGYAISVFMWSYALYPAERGSSSASCRN